MKTGFIVSVCVYKIRDKHAGVWWQQMEAQCENIVYAHNVVFSQFLIIYAYVRDGRLRFLLIQLSKLIGGLLARGSQSWKEAHRCGSELCGSELCSVDIADMFGSICVHRN